MTFTEKIVNIDQSLTFAEVIAYIDEEYDFTPTRFTNGDLVNEAGQNSGSCKILSLAKLQNLSIEQTLNLFGDYYKVDMLQNPEGIDHQNIRNLMQTGLDGVVFVGQALRKK